MLWTPRVTVRRAGIITYSKVHAPLYHKKPVFSPDTITKWISSKHRKGKYILLWMGRVEVNLSLCPKWFKTKSSQWTCCFSNTVENLAGAKCDKILERQCTTVPRHSCALSLRAVLTPFEWEALSRHLAGAISRVIEPVKRLSGKGEKHGKKESFGLGEQPY